MIKGLTALVVVPARGGSKGIPGKNLSKINGESLIAIVGNVIRDIGWSDCAVLSSDNKDIIEEALAHGISVPFIRPADLSGDIVNGIEVWRHALKSTEEIFNQQFDLSVLLEPTSPCRTSSHVEKAVMKLIDTRCDSLLTVSRTDSNSHPLKQLTIKSNYVSSYLAEGKKIIARQQLDQLYHRNGVAYVARREFIMEHDSIIGTNTGALIIDEEVANIDTPLDLKRAKMLLGEGGV